MLSGNGRHRRPRQAPALLVAAGVTGSALAIPLFAATGASAASGTTWDRVAECESGGSWSANSGNGFYGGLQLTQADWEKYGGLTYAPSADQASRSQQIAVAENVLADQGAGAWEACALLSGLGKDTGSADVDTGVAEGDGSTEGSGSGSGMGMGLGSASGSGSSSSSSSSSSSTSTSVSPTPSASPSTESSVSTKSSESSPSSSPSVEATTDSAGSVESSVPPSLFSSSSDVGNSQEGDSSPTGATKGEEQGNSVQSAGSGTGGAEGSYTVRVGDTLWGIADSLGLAGGWSELYTENEPALGVDPNLILPGQTLAVGDEPGQN